VTEGAPTGFENGAPVPAVDPEIFFDDPPPAAPRCALDSDQLLDLLITGARDTEEIAARALVLAMLSKRPAAPKSVAAFAAWLNIPETSGRRFWRDVSQCLQGELKIFGGRAP
jgi:hypothetical protein